jgi:hypothetical protein
MRTHEDAIFDHYAFEDRDVVVNLDARADAHAHVDVYAHADIAGLAD